jgi:hypothetical protein
MARKGKNPTHLSNLATFYFGYRFSYFKISSLEVVVVVTPSDLTVQATT